MKITRFPENPIINRSTPGLEGSAGDNINGPSLIRVPDWLPNALGKYYLYFAHHGGKYIRLAYADDLHGPWKVYEKGTLWLEQTPCTAHIASPDVHVDEERRQIRMYFHGVPEQPENYSVPQRSYVAVSGDGIAFDLAGQDLGPFYFRVFEYGGWHYALAKSDPDTTLLRSRDGLSQFVEGPHLLPRARHTAVVLRGDTAYVFLSRIGDSPERILLTTIDLTLDWTKWRDRDYLEVLAPETEYEGAHIPVEASVAGASRQPVCQLRDPAVFEEDGRLFLVFSVAGEKGLGIAEIQGL